MNFIDGFICCAGIMGVTIFILVFVFSVKAMNGGK